MVYYDFTIKYCSCTDGLVYYDFTIIYGSCTDGVVYLVFCIYDKYEILLNSLEDFLLLVPLHHQGKQVMKNRSSGDWCFVQVLLYILL